MNKTTPQNHGHRGARGLSPENTLASIRTGVDCGCDAIEVDLCVSKDNQLVLHHDPVLSPRLVRNTNGQWINDRYKVRDLTALELKQFDVGRINPQSGYAKLFPEQIPIDGARIPVLADFVALITDMQSDITYNLELKSTPFDLGTTPPVEEYVDLVVEALHYHDIVGRSFLQSFDWRLAIQIKALFAGIESRNANGSTI